MHSNELRTNQSVEYKKEKQFFQAFVKNMTTDSARLILLFVNFFPLFIQIEAM